MVKPASFLPQQAESQREFIKMIQQVFVETFINTFVIL